MEKRTLRITGTGRISQKPDQVLIIFDISSKHYKYSDCLKDLTKKTSLLRENIKFVGLEPESLKTDDLSINTDYKWRDNNKIFNGYIGTHQLSIEFDLDKELLNRVLDSIAGSLTNTEFSIYFQAKDCNSLKARILENAVLDAKTSAEIISRSSGIKLGKIREIIYSWAEVRFHSDFRLYDKSVQLLEDESLNYDIEPKDINAKDTVIVEWDIE